MNGRLVWIEDLQLWVLWDDVVASQSLGDYYTQQQQRGQQQQQQRQSGRGIRTWKSLPPLPHEIHHLLPMPMDIGPSFDPNDRIQRRDHYYPQTSPMNARTQLQWASLAGQLGWSLFLCACIWKRKGLTDCSSSSYGLQRSSAIASCATSLAVVSAVITAGAAIAVARCSTSPRQLSLLYLTVQQADAFAVIANWNILYNMHIYGLWSFICFFAFTSMVFWVGYRLRGIASSRFFLFSFASIYIVRPLKGCYSMQ